MTTTTHQPDLHRRTWRDGLRAGALAGLVAAVAGAVAHIAVVEVTGNRYPELNVASVAVVSLVALTIGGVVYAVLAARLRRPDVVFGVLALLAVAAETAAASTRGAGFLLEATVLHVVAAGIAVLFIPRLYRRR